MPSDIPRGKPGQIPGKQVETIINDGRNKPLALAMKILYINPCPLLMNYSPATNQTRFTTVIVIFVTIIIFAGHIERPLFLLVHNVLLMQHYRLPITKHPQNYCSPTMEQLWTSCSLSSFLDIPILNTPLVGDWKETSPDSPCMVNDIYQ